MQKLGAAGSATFAWTSFMNSGGRILQGAVAVIIFGQTGGS